MRTMNIMVIDKLILEKYLSRILVFRVWNLYLEL
jgi:hypothetical protein